jgi:tRNA(His) guanylyltransferase
MNDPLGDRMKDQYENRTRYFLPRRTYTILRLDGKAFHTYTKNLEKPFDKGLSEDLDNAIIAMVSELQGVVFAYTQSDEISVLLTDFATPTTAGWFDGNLQKMVSVSASIMTAEFNKQRMIRFGKWCDEQMEEKNVTNIVDTFDLAYFDCRAFTIPDRTEVMNYFRWRQQDCIRNSVSMVAQANFSHRALHGKSQSEMHEMLHAKGVNWATDFSDCNKNGRIITKETYVVDFTLRHTSFSPEGITMGGEGTTRSRWVSNGAWVFTQDKGLLLGMIPAYEP